MLLSGHKPTLERRTPHSLGDVVRAVVRVEALLASVPCLAPLLLCRQQVTGIVRATVTARLNIRKGSIIKKRKTKLKRPGYFELRPKMRYEKSTRYIGTSPCGQSAQLRVLLPPLASRRTQRRGPGGTSRPGSKKTEIGLKNDQRTIKHNARWKTTTTVNR